MINLSLIGITPVLLISLISLTIGQNITKGPCTTPSMEKGICIHLDQCVYLVNMMMQKPLPTEDRDFLKHSQCAFTDGKVFVCCSEDKNDVEIRSIFNTRETKIRASLPEPGSCGIQFEDRIYGGNVTKIDEHPSMALIEYNKGGTINEHHCGGSLINDRYVLTAAHCISGIPDIWKPTRVRLGEWNTTTNPDCEKYSMGAEFCADPHIDVTIEKAIPHEKYVALSQSQPNDIALLRLSRSIKYSHFIKPICLPIADHLRQATFDGQSMQVSGWGSTPNATRSKVKLKADVSVVSLKNITKGPCTTPNMEKGFCIHLDQCIYLLNMMMQKPLPTEDRDFLKHSQCAFTNGKVFVCCSEDKIDVEIRSIFNTRESKIRASLPEPGSCVSQFENRIYGGNVTEIREHPYMALIEYNKDGKINGHHCGGSLINDRYVLTAAHCISGIPDIWKPTRVRLGEWNTTTDPDCQKYNLGAEFCADPHIDVTIEKAIPHEQYEASSQTQPNDIALLRLSRSITYSDFIKPICLPIADHLRQATFDGQLMQVSGWGSTPNATRSKVKLKADVKVVSLSKCQSVYTSPTYDIQNSQICAGGEKGIDSCEGYSGGPLIGFDSSNKGMEYQFIAGVVSFGPTPCGFEGWPGVYTRVGDYIDWILEHMEP